MYVQNAFLISFKISICILFYILSYVFPIVLINFLFFWFFSDFHMSAPECWNLNSRSRSKRKGSKEFVGVIFFMGIRTGFNPPSAIYATQKKSFIGFDVCSFWTLFRHATKYRGIYYLNDWYFCPSQFFQNDIFLPKYSENFLFSPFFSTFNSLYLRFFLINEFFPKPTNKSYPPPPSGGGPQNE